MRAALAVGLPSSVATFSKLICSDLLVLRLKCHGHTNIFDVDLFEYGPEQDYVLLGSRHLERSLIGVDLMILEFVQI